MIGRQLNFDAFSRHDEPFPLRILVDSELHKPAGQVLHHIDIALNACEHPP